MGRMENVEVFRDTERMCRLNVRLAQAIEESVSAQKVILEDDPLPPVEGRLEEADVVISGRRTFEAAADYAPRMKTVVLNFASASNPGGGVVNGSSAQEESLCRCSTLYPCLASRGMWDGFYGPHRAAHNPLHNDDAIYTPGVVVFKTDTSIPRRMDEESWYRVDVISCAAPNLRSRMDPGGVVRHVSITSEALGRLHERRLARILDIAAANGAEAVILGAFGCGAFMNDPTVVAGAAARIVPQYTHLFKTIEFAVYCRPDDRRNLDAFKRAFLVQPPSDPFYCEANQRHLQQAAEDVRRGHVVEHELIEDSRDGEHE